MLVAFNELENVDKQLPIFLDSLLVANLVRILLDSPYSPQEHVRLLYLVDKACEWLANHEIPDALGCRIHNKLEIVIFLNGKRETRKGNECISCTNLEPRIASEQIALCVAYANMELVSCIYECVIEIVGRDA